MTLSDTTKKIYDYQRWQLPSLDKVANDDSFPPVSQQEIQALEEQSRAKGFEIGKWEGLEAGKAEAEERAKKLGALLDAAAKPLADLDQQVAKELTTLAMTIAQSLVKHELNIAPEVVMSIVDDAIAGLPPYSDTTTQPIDILLHPDDAALVAEMIAEQPDKRGWRIIKKPEISRGGCQISTPDSFIDATLEARSNAILAGLVESFDQGVAQQNDHPPGTTSARQVDE